MRDEPIVRSRGRRLDAASTHECLVGGNKVEQIIESAFAIQH
jgi:hypothetical protein